MFDSLEKSGCRIDLIQQSNRSYALENLVASLSSFSSSNRDLGIFLQDNGYLRLIDFIQEPKIDIKTKDSFYKQWDSSFKGELKWKSLLFQIIITEFSSTLSREGQLVLVIL